MESKVIRLFFTEISEEEISLVVPGFKIIRLVGKIAFKTDTGWSKFYSAIIDTGSHLSLIPKSIWEKCQVKKLKETKIRGLSSEKDISLSVSLGKITCVLADPLCHSGALEIHSFLASDDDNPLLIGFGEILQRYKLVINYQKKEAFLEWEE